MAYWGEYTWCFGLGWVLGAAIYQGIFYRDMFWENMKSNLCLGALCVVAGVPLHIIGVKKLDRLAFDYNSQHPSKKPSISIGAQQYGFGLAINF